MEWQWYDKRNEQTHYTPKHTGWGTILDYLKNPISGIYDKKAVPLWSFYNTVKDPALDANGLPHAKSINFRYFHALQVDFEERGATIEWFMEKYKEYRYMLYTSFNHTNEAPRFRVIIQLRSTFANVMMACPDIKEYLIDMFPGCDPSTFNTFRRQHIPAINPTRPDVYQWYANIDGNPLLINQFDFLPAYNAWQKGLNIEDYSQDNIFNTPIDKLSHHSADKAAIFELTVGKTQWINGSRNNTMWGLISWGVKLGLSPWEIRSVMIANCPSGMGDELNQMLKRI